MFCGLGEEERTKNRKEKKKKKLIAAKSGLVGMKEYLKTYNHMKYCLPYLNRFWLIETAVYAKLAGRFSGSKMKVR